VCIFAGVCDDVDVINNIQHDIVNDIQYIFFNDLDLGSTVVVDNLDRGDCKHRSAFGHNHDIHVSSEEPEFVGLFNIDKCGGATVDHHDRGRFHDDDNRRRD
jgi:hypothetical protein